MAKKRQSTSNGKPDILALAMRRVYEERMMKQPRETHRAAPPKAAQKLRRMRTD